MFATGNAASQKRLIVSASIAAIATVYASPASAFVVVTTDPAQAAAFQAGATIENFDNLSALTITSYANGQTVPSANQFVSRNPVAFTDPFFNSGGATFTDPVSNPGTPIGIFAPSGAIAGDVRSAPNVVGPLQVGTDIAFGNGFMEVIFPTDMRRIGLWVTHGTFTIFLKDSTNNNHTTGDFEVTGSAGQFIGIERDTADVRGLTMGFPEAFTFDDFTYATTPIPEPAALGLLGVAGVALVSRRRRHG